jgi:hypothetical protein
LPYFTVYKNVLIQASVFHDLLCERIRIFLYMYYYIAFLNSTDFRTSPWKWGNEWQLFTQHGGWAVGGNGSESRKAVCNWRW